MGRPWTDRFVWVALALAPFAVAGFIRGVLSGVGVIDSVETKTAFVIVALTILATEAAHAIRDAGRVRWVRRTAAVTPLRDSLAEIDRILSKYTDKKADQ